MATVTYKRKNLPVQRPQTIQIGDDWIGETFRHKNPNGTPVNLTGCTIVGKLKKPDGTTIDLVINRDDLNGSYYPSLARATTALLAAGAGRFDIDLTDTLDRKTTYWGGPVTIKAVI